MGEKDVSVRRQNKTFLLFSTKSELPRCRMEGEASASARASLRRQRFSGFYDLKVRQDANEHDIDSTHFNSESYVQSVRTDL